MITEDMYLLAKKVIENYEKTNIQPKPPLTTIEECEIEAKRFADKAWRIVGNLLSDDYKVGYEEGITHYLEHINKTNNNDKLLIEKQREYIQLLSDELNSLGGLAFSHGWVSKKEKVDAGIKLRNEISQLENNEK